MRISVTLGYVIAGFNCKRFKNHFEKICFHSHRNFMSTRKSEHSFQPKYSCSQFWIITRSRFPVFIYINNQAVGNEFTFRPMQCQWQIANGRWQMAMANPNHMRDDVSPTAGFTWNSFIFSTAGLDIFCALPNQSSEASTSFSIGGMNELGHHWTASFKRSQQEWQDEHVPGVS